MKKLFLITTVALSIVACNNQETSKETTIIGNISNLAEGTQIYLDFLTPQKLITKDTATIDAEGNFAFDYHTEELGYYRIKINDQNFANFIFDQNQKATVKGDGSNLMDTYTVEGSEQSNLFKEFNTAAKANYLKRDSISKLYQANSGNPANKELLAQLEEDFIAIANNFAEYAVKVIDKNPASLVSMAAVEQLNPDEYLDYYKKVDEALASKMANSPYYQNFHAKVNEHSKLAVGTVAPDFTANDKDGNPISLSSLKGKVVLIDFWASWCKPCRAENPNVVAAYKQFNKKGFEVLSVSLDGMPQQGDQAKEQWLQAIQDDGLIWNNHITELKGWN